MPKKALSINTTTGDIERTADLVESSEVVTTPTINGIPRADVYGKIAPGWVGGPLDISVLPVADDGEVSSTEVVRANDSRLGNPPVGGDLSGTTAAAAVIKIQGRAVQNTSPSDGQVLTWNNGASRWEPATPAGGGASLTLEEIDGTPSVDDVTMIRVSNGSLTDEGGGVVTLSVGGGGGTSSIGGTLYLFNTYR